MKKINSIILILIIFIMNGFSSDIKGNTPVTQGVSKSTNWHATLAKMTDKNLLKKHMKEYPERWKAAFEFLSKSNLETLPVGEYKIMGSDVYAIVSEYEPRKIEDCMFESHKKYIDIQYVIKGKELIGLTTIDKVQPKVEYDKQKDIAFYTSDKKAEYETATPDNYFVFFPENLHRPSIQKEAGLKVKKIVIKLKF